MSILSRWFSPTSKPSQESGSPKPQTATSVAPAPEKIPLAAPELAAPPLLAPWVPPVKPFDFSKCHMVIPVLDSGPREKQLEILKRIDELIDIVEPAQDKNGLEYTRYQLGHYWRINCHRIADHLAPLACDEDVVLRRAAMKVLGKMTVLEYRNGATVLVSAGASMQRHAREQQEYAPYQEVAGVAAQTIGRAAHFGVKFPGDRRVLILGCEDMPDPVGDALFMVESEISEAAVEAMTRGLTDADAEIRNFAVEGLELVLLYSEEEAVREVLERTAAQSPDAVIAAAAGSVLIRIDSARKSAQNPD